MKQQNNYLVMITSPRLNKDGFGGVYKYEGVKMKRFICTILLMSLMLSLFGCQSDKPSPDDKEAKKASFEIAEEFMSKIVTEDFCPEEYMGRKPDVTYGKMEKARYYSDTCGRERNVNVVLPDGYSEDKEYPVLYVLHGAFGNEDSMANMDFNGKNVSSQIIIGNMIADGTAKDMIIVFPYIFASREKEAYTDNTIEEVKGYDNFVNEIANDLMPFIEENYSIAKGKDNTAIFGFSMGGREALAVGLAYPDKFGYIGGACPAPGLIPGKDWLFDHPGQYTEDELVFEDEAPYLILIASGGSDGMSGEFPEKYHKLFDEHGVSNVWYTVPDSGHGEPAISSLTYNFAKNLFKAK